MAAILLVVVTLPGSGGSAQAGSSAPREQGHEVAQPSQVGGASRVDIDALVRSGTRTRPASGVPRYSERTESQSALGRTGVTASSTAETSSNWSGYVVGAGPYTSVTGTFNVPNLAAAPTGTVTSEWVGIDGSDNSSLIQAGVSEVYDPSTNLVYTSAAWGGGPWWEILPAPSTLITTMAVAPGDSVTVTIWQISGTLWGITLADDTTGRSFTTDQSYSGPGTSAEWIVEAPISDGIQLTLGRYSPAVTFSGVRMNGPETTLTPWIMVQGGVTVSAPSTLTTAGFSVAYVGAFAPTPMPAATPTPTPAPSTRVYTVTLGQQFDLKITGGTPYLQAQWQVSRDAIAWTPLVTVALDASGNSTYAFTPSQTAYYRAYYPGLAQYSSWLLEVIVLAASPSPVVSPPPATSQCVQSIGPGIPPPQGALAEGIGGYHAAWYGQSGYPTLCPGQRSVATVAYLNSGSLGWVLGRPGQTAYLGTWDPEPGQDKPSPLGGDGTQGSPWTGWPAYNRPAVQPAGYVGPGQIAWFQFQIQAPVTPGTYRLALRPLIEGTQWMEDYGVFWYVTVQ